jgi:hypothetical protein
VIGGPFSRPADGEGVVAARPTWDYTVPPDVWSRRQRFLVGGIGVSSELLVLHVGTIVVLGLQKRGSNSEVNGGRVQRGKLWCRGVFASPVVEPFYVVDRCGP